MPGTRSAFCQVPACSPATNIPPQVGLVYDPTAVQLLAIGQEIDSTLENGCLLGVTWIPGTGSGFPQPSVLTCAAPAAGTAPSRSTAPTATAPTQREPLLPLGPE